MENVFNQIFGDSLPAEHMVALQEAFNAKIAEREEEIREELAARYEHDKSTMVEAMDKMLTDAIKTFEGQKKDEILKIVEARNEYRKAIRENRKLTAAKLRENVEVSRKFVSERLSEQVKALNEKKARLAEAVSRMAEDLETHKRGLSEQHTSNLKKINEFVVRGFAKEIKGLEMDRKNLVEQRVRFVAEGRKVMREMQRKFVKESAKKIDKAVTEGLAREMKGMHEDIERHRKMSFGARIFEAVAYEYMNSFMVEGTEISKLKAMLESQTSELKNMKAKLDESVKIADVAQRKVKLAEDRAARTKIMSELLNNLRGDKRQVMEGMLETVKTAELRESFDKLLPVVLNEQRKAPPAKKALNERADKTRSVVTGDQRVNRLHETVQAENQEEFDGELSRLVKLAGLK